MIRVSKLYYTYCKALCLEIKLDKDISELNLRCGVYRLTYTYDNIIVFPGKLGFNIYKKLTKSVIINLLKNEIFIKQNFTLFKSELFYIENIIILDRIYIDEKYLLEKR